MARVVNISAWHIGAAALIFFLPGVMVGKSFWTMTKLETAFLLYWSVGYLVAASYLGIGQIKGRIRPLSATIGALAVTGLLLTSVILAGFYNVRVGMILDDELFQYALTSYLFAGALFFMCSFWLPQKRGQHLASAVVAMVVGLLILAQLYTHRFTASTPQKATRIVDSSLYALRMTRFTNHIPQSRSRGGGLDLLGDKILLVNGDGRFFLLDLNKDGDVLKAIQLPYSVPTNAQAFLSDTGLDTHPLRFRVADLLTQQLDHGYRVFVSHHFWSDEDQCVTLRLSSTEGPIEVLVDPQEDLQWKTVFESTPCLEPGRGKRGNAFAGHVGGGRMALLNPTALLLGIGDFGYNGWTSKKVFSQDPEVDYGKIVAIDLEDGNHRHYSTGHRNPQGLLVEDGEIWQTEHGPRGGDELNLIREGRNYGWPLATYGTGYDMLTWPPAKKQGRHSEFERPVHAWLPSIGISSLIRADSRLFPLWEGDLLISSLTGKALHRTRIRDRRVVFLEPVKVGYRIRDLTIIQDGRILLYTDEGHLLALAPETEALTGESIFVTRCWGCHSTHTEDSGRIGPNLSRIVGRPVASVPGFRYSSAMKELGGNWTEDRLSKFLTDPQDFSPGTAMEFDGISNPAERAALMDYLGKLSGR